MKRAGSGLIDWAPQGLAITDQGVDRSCYAGLGCDPLLQQSLKTLHIQLSEQQPEGEVRRRLGDLGAEQLVEGLAVAFGKTLHAHQRALVAENGEDGHQEHPPLRVAIPRRMRQSGSALKRLIRSVAEEGFWCGETNAVKSCCWAQQRRCRSRQG